MKKLIILLLLITQLGIAQTKLATLNGLLRSKFTVTTSETRIFKSTELNSILCDVSNDPVLGQKRDCNNATNYIDYVHLTTAGKNIYSPYFKSCSNVTSINL